MNCPFCNNADANSSLPQADIRHIECPHCGPVDLGGAAITFAPSAEDKQLLAQHFLDTEGKSRAILTSQGLEDLLYELRAARDEKQLNTELNRKKT
jgi:Zn ribbon nucleic-acid-binding protein